MYHFNSYTANTVIQNLNYDKQYLQSQLTSVYEKNSNLEYDNNKLKIQLEKSREIYKQLGNSYDSLNISYNNLSDDYNILLNSPSNKRSLETNNENNTLNNKTYKKTRYSLSDERIHELINNLKNIEDIINLPKDTLIRHHPDVNKLLNVRKPLEKLNNMIGLDSIKNELFKHIIYFIINKESIYENNRLHTVIQ